MYTERRYKKRLHRNRPFLFLGNEVDGRLFCDKKYYFKSLSDLKKNLQEVIVQINGEGEWIFELYQVPKEHKIWHRWGYYKYPSRGTMLFQYDYMSLPIGVVEFLEREISFVAARKSRPEVIKYVGNNFEVEINRLIWDWK